MGNRLKRPILVVVMLIAGSQILGRERGVFHRAEEAGIGNMFCALEKWGDINYDGMSFRISVFKV